MKHEVSMTFLKGNAHYLPVYGRNDFSITNCQSNLGCVQDLGARTNCSFVKHGTVRPRWKQPHSK